MHATKLAMSPTRWPRTFRLPTPSTCNDAGNVTVVAKKLNFSPKLAIALVAALFLGLKTTVSGRLDLEITTNGNDSPDATASYQVGQEEIATTLADQADGQTHKTITTGSGLLKSQEGHDNYSFDTDVEVTPGGTTVVMTADNNTRVTIKRGPQGHLLSKVDAANKGLRIDRKPDGTPKRMTRSGQGHIDYQDDHGRITKMKLVTYGHDATQESDNELQPAIGMDYYNTGHIKEIVDASGLRSLNYHKGRLDQEIITSSDDSLNRLAGFTIDRGYDARNRLTTIAVKRGGQTLHSISYGRDGFGRVDSVSSADGVSASYMYYTGSNQLHTLTRHGVTTTWQRFPDDGALDRVTTSAGDGNRTFEHRYVGSRRVVIDSIHDIRKGVVWNYSYQNRQLTGADGGAGRVFDYAYGELGNRTNANANSANEIQVVTRPVDERTFVIAGSAAPAAQVELSFAGADPISVPNLQGNFSFTFTAPHNSGTAPLRIPVLVRGTVPGQGTDGADAIAEELRQLVVLPTFNDSQTDGSGNLGFDGKWHMRWTVRDKLKRMWTQRSVAEATGIYETLVFNYNAEGQRIYKRYRKYEDDDEDGFAEVLLEDRIHRTVYDAMWHPLFEQVEDGQTGQIVRELAYVWGPDLTGTVGGAGGIGGLLAIVDLTNQKTYLPVYDGRGNVVSVVDAASGQTVAEWDYGPFGEMVEEVEHEPGVLEVCQFQYQTKYTDAETGYVYFGHRYLNTVTGRWLSREPLGEMESVNLYAYCRNEPVGNFDRWGLDVHEVNWYNVFFFKHGPFFLGSFEWIGLDEDHHRYDPEAGFGVFVGDLGTIFTSSDARSDLKKGLLSVGDGKATNSNVESFGKAFGNGVMLADALLTRGGGRTGPPLQYRMYVPNSSGSGRGGQSLGKSIVAVEPTTYITPAIPQPALTLTGKPSDPLPPLVIFDPMPAPLPQNPGLIISPPLDFSESIIIEEPIGLIELYATPGNPIITAGEFPGIVLPGIPAVQRVPHITSSGELRNRGLVTNEDELFGVAQAWAGGNLDSWIDLKHGNPGTNFRWQSRDGNWKIELELRGHARTNEGPHVTIERLNPTNGGFDVVDKVFIRNWEEWMRNWNP